MLKRISETIEKELLPSHGKKGSATLKYFMISAPFFTEIDKKSFLIFLNNNAIPDFVLILVQNKLGQEIISITKSLSSVLKDNITIPILSFPIDDYLAMVYEYIHSFRFEVYPKRIKRKLVRQSLELLVKIAKDFLYKNNDFWTKEELEADIKEDLTFFSHKYNNNNLLKKLEKDFDDLLEYSSLRKIAKIPQHGDYAIENIRFIKNEIYIFDLDLFYKIKLPFYDFICYFISLLCFEREMIYADLSRSPYYDLYVDFIKTYSRHLQLEEKILYKLLPFLLIKRLKYYDNYGRLEETIESVYKIIENYYGFGKAI